MASLFRNVIQFALGDLIGKALNFLAFVYLARTLGASAYGVLEFAVSMLGYFLLAADCGLELWATREAAQGGEPRKLVGRIVPLRVLLAVVGFGLLIAVLSYLPEFPGLKSLMLLFGGTLFTQAINLKWLFMGRERMGKVAQGLVVSQIIFALAVFSLVGNPEDVLWVPIAKLFSDLLLVIYFAFLFLKHHPFRFHFTLKHGREVLATAITMGAAHGLALMNYNFDSVLLGFLKDSTSVGLYNAAYKPVTVMLAIPVSYFLGLLPAFTRAIRESEESFHNAMIRSLRLTSLFGLPAVVGVALLSEPIILSLFGPGYQDSIPVLKILAWSAVIVILRGTYRQALTAAGHQKMDLRCAMFSTVLNVTLNFALIPGYGIAGAATATLISEILWLGMASYYSHRALVNVKLVPLLQKPAIAVLAMALVIVVSRQIFWMVGAGLGILIYLVVLWLLQEPEIRSWLRKQRR